MQEILTGLRNPALLDSVDLGNRLQGTLRPYQQEGLAWLHLLSGLGLGACLADDMGLGKTVQVLALLLCQKRKEPSLLVLPASLLSNWRAEASRFAPSLRLLFVHPSETDRATLDGLGNNSLKNTLKTGYHW